MTYAVPEEVADRVIAAFLEGRAIQREWREVRNGKELVRALAAFSPNIKSPEDCPAEYMPDWLAQLIPTLYDGIAADQVVPFFIGLGERAKLWSVLDLEAWERVRVAFLSHCISDALAEAESVCPQPRPVWFTQVRDACEMVLAALRGEGKLATANVATYAAAHATASATAYAAYAAYAAYITASATAFAAGSTTAYTAANVAVTAAENHAAYQRQVDALFSALDAEITTASDKEPNQ
jgi:hypothetical protein